MTGIIENIATLLGIHRDERKLPPRRKRISRLWRESDTVTISEEARHLLVCEGNDGVAGHEVRLK
jgi:hypothetical protein